MTSHYNITEQERRRRKYYFYYQTTFKPSVLRTFAIEFSLPSLKIVHPRTYVDCCQLNLVDDTFVPLIMASSQWVSHKIQHRSKVILVVLIDTLNTYLWSPRRYRARPVVWWAGIKPCWGWQRTREANSGSVLARKIRLRSNIRGVGQQCTFIPRLFEGQRLLIWSRAMRHRL